MARLAFLALMQREFRSSISASRAGHAADADNRRGGAHVQRRCRTALELTSRSSR